MPMNILLQDASQELFKVNEMQVNTSFDPYQLSQPVTDQKRNEHRINRRNESARSYASKNSESSKILQKFEKTMKEVRDSLNHSPINFTKRDPGRAPNILESKSVQ
jgi:hypothetical protein